jgi:anhydro-N-acetylmuramic acid kinase
MYAETIAYDKTWRKMLSVAHLLSGEDLIRLHTLYGHYLGNLINAFCKKNAIDNVDFISSHGHTIFHQPQLGFTFQLGDGHAIHAITGKQVVFDFRSLDVARGGQGAPLVPVGDHLLFHEYDVCLNIGGIANCSMQQNKKRIAFDICFANMILNHLSDQVGKKFDKDGAMAASGRVDKRLLERLMAGYSKIRGTRPSLGREFFEDKIQPLVDHSEVSVPDKLATAIESIAIEIGRSISDGKRKTVLCTGGGAFNHYLMFRLLERVGDKVSLVIPNESLVKFKEAIVFGFLGVLRVRNEVNCLKSVTGATHDSSSGTMIGF